MEGEGGVRQRIQTLAAIFLPGECLNELVLATFMWSARKIVDSVQTFAETPLQVFLSQPLMAGMLARLAELRARREASTARPPPVDAALAAAAAAIGSPTRGTWDADYLQRLRHPENSRGAALSDVDSDEEEVVVLPPPQVKLDPVAQRTAWRNRMLHEAKQARRASTADRPILGFAKQSFVFEELTEEPEEEDDEFEDEDGGMAGDDDEEEDGQEDEEGERVEVDDGSDEDEQNQRGVEEGANRDESNGTLTRLPNGAKKEDDDSKTGSGVESLDSDNDEDLRPQSSSVRQGEQGVDASAVAEGSDQSVSKECTRGEASTLFRSHLIRDDGKSMFIEDEAEEEDAHDDDPGGDSEDELINEEEEEDSRQVDDQPDTFVEGANFHRQWQVEKDREIVRAIVGSNRGASVELRVQNDNAVDIAETFSHGNLAENLVTDNVTADTHPDLDKVEEM
jgi:hypothetical protein